MSEAPGVIDRLRNRLGLKAKPQPPDIAAAESGPSFFNYSFSETRPQKPRLEPEEEERLKAMEKVVLEVHERMMTDWQASQTVNLLPEYVAATRDKPSYPATQQELNKFQEEYNKRNPNMPLDHQKVDELRSYLAGDAPWEVSEVYLGKGFASHTRDLDVFEQSGDRIRATSYHIIDITDKLANFLVIYVSEDYPVLGEPHQAILIGRKGKEAFEVIGTARDLELESKASTLGKFTSQYLQAAGFTEIHGVELYAKPRLDEKLPSAYHVEHLRG